MEKNYSDAICCSSDDFHRACGWIVHSKLIHFDLVLFTVKFDFIDFSKLAHFFEPAQSCG